MDRSDAIGQRDAVIVRTSMIGILVNLLLAAFKAAVGILSHSIAIILDAVNNLSDAFSSVVTIIGTKLAAKRPDRKHPLGHGRIEYLSAMIVSAIVLYAGITSLVESVRKILHPEKAEYSAATIVILISAIAAKLLLGRYVKKKGEEVHSGALIASGSDASFDAFLSLSVLASAVIFLVSGISLEAYVGVLLSVFILKAGVELMLDNVDDILGRRADEETSRTIKKILNEEPEVYGAYDLMLNNYGPDRNFASVHIELPDTMTVKEVDLLTRKLEAEVYRATGVILTGVGVYSFNTASDEASHIRNAVQKAVLSHDWALQLHGFYVDTSAKTMRFDVVLSFEIDANEALQTLHREIEATYPAYHIQITPDIDLTD